MKMIDSIPEEKSVAEKKALQTKLPASRLLRSISQLVSDEGLTKKATFNAIATILEYAANLIVTFILTPIMVRYLGEYFYGLWQVLNRIVGYISPTSGRPSYALKWSLANQRESIDFQEKRRQVYNSILVWLIFLPIMMTSGGIVTWFVPYWVSAPQQYYWIIRIASALLVGNMTLGAVSQIPLSALQGENKGYKRMGMSTLLIFIENGLTWLTLYLGWGIIGIAISLVLATVISGIFYLWVVRVYIPWFGIAKTSFESLKKFFGLSWWFLAWNLVINLLMNSDVVVLGIMQSVISVTSFTLTKYVPDTIISVVTMIVFGILPGLGGIIGTGNLVKASRVRGEIMAITWLIVTVLGASILLWNRSFLTLWVGGNQFAGTFQDLLIIILATQLVFLRNDANIIDVTLRLTRKVILGVISMALSILLAAIAVGYFKLGVIGLCIGIMLGRSLLSLGYPILIGRYLNIHFSSQVKSALRPILATLGIYLLVTLIDYTRFIHTGSGFLGWIVFVLGVIATVIVVLPLSFYLGLSGGQRRNIMQRIRAILPGR